jgi:hypothetical protein
VELEGSGLKLGQIEHIVDKIPEHCSRKNSILEEFFHLDEEALLKDTLVLDLLQMAALQIYYIVLVDALFSQRKIILLCVVWLGSKSHNCIKQFSILFLKFSIA